jgi:membrane associated rhomboid family serine protease
MDVQDPNLATASSVLLRFRHALNLSMVAVIVLAAIFFLQNRIGDLDRYAIHPQDWSSLPAILTAPLLHGSLEHLASNALSVLILGTLAGTVFPRATLRALPLIWIGAGLGTWWIGTAGYHLGISGITHGLGFLVFTLALLRRDRASIAAALIAFFFFGGMLLTVLPQEWGVSWEYHLSGAVMGILAGVLWRRADPLPPRRRYSWEDEPEEDLQWEEVEPARPNDVPILWHRPERPPGGAVLPFRRRVKDED